MNSVLTDALNGREHSGIPVWYMRQAGRHMPGFAKYLSQDSLPNIIRNPEKSSEIAIEAVDKLGVDAAIMFSDIVTPLEAAGLEYSYKHGPILKTHVLLDKFENMVSSMDDKKLWFIRDQIAEIKRAVNVPVIGFAGAPFTLASYIIEGRYVREFPKTKSLMINMNWEGLFNAISDLIIKDITVQVNAGVSVIQLFDTWVGALSEEQFEKYYLEKLSGLITYIKSLVPVIYFCTDCLHLITKIARKARPTFISVDWKISMESLYNAERIGVQGNLDPVYSLVGGKAMLEEANTVLSSMHGINRYIFNLGHGVIPGTDWRELKKLTEYVHSWH
ncbi:MAG: uroporphyrinogen decarboxylase family protein [Conexivisphaerales archaeon]